MCGLNIANQVHHYNYLRDMSSYHMRSDYFSGGKNNRKHVCKLTINNNLTSLVQSWCRSVFRIGGKNQDCGGVEGQKVTTGRKLFMFIY